jgi:cell cycle sensor histidine kinase DivJ
VLERTNFFAGLGHDLKSPLNAVIGFADVMDAEIRGPMPDAYKDYPGLIRESGETLLRLVEDMLGYARSETGAYELDLAPMDIAASGESVMRQSQAVADKAGIGLRMICDREVLALADAGAVRRIWDNLVSNAIKYSAAGDTVTLLSDVKHDQAIIQVRDTGTGMDADDLARIASPFSQGRNAKGRAGTGLGLALVHRLAEMQGGKVQIETAPGAGTTVTVTIPALSESQKRAAE